MAIIPNPNLRSKTLLLYASASRNPIFYVSALKTLLLYASVSGNPMLYVSAPKTLFALRQCVRDTFALPQRIQCFKP